MKKKAIEIHRILSTVYPDVKTQLDFKTPFQLLVATILSAQCTDKRVNQVTPALFLQLPGPKDFAEADIATIENLIHSTGFYHNKAGNIQKCAQMLMERFHGSVPHTMKELIALPGVGRKTANVVLGAAFGTPGIVVDTHVARICRRLGLTQNQNPEKIEKDLMALLPQKFWNAFCLRLIYFGRSTCKARKPGCPLCPLLKLCPFETPEKTLKPAGKAKTAAKKRGRLNKTERKAVMVINVKRMASQLGLEDADIFDVLELFVQTAPSDIEKLKDAFYKENTAQVEAAAHSLKGSTSTLGFTKISLQARKIMSQARQSDLDGLALSVPLFLDAMHGLLSELIGFLMNTKP